MKVLWLHNHYKVHGGESAAADREAALLRAHGVEVVQHAAENHTIDAMGVVERALLPLRNAWSRASYRTVRELCRTHRPDVVHAHNVWPLLSPSVFAAARSVGVPTVFTAHNFYLQCLNGVFFRDGRICTDCKGGLPWPGVVHRCYRGLGGSLTRLFGTAVHRARGVFAHVDRILTPTAFARQHFLDTGFAAERVRAKWLSCEDPFADRAVVLPPPPKEPRFLVACRLVPEKGVQVAIDAAALAKRPWRLDIAGEGPERTALQAHITARGVGDRVTLLGHVDKRVLPDRIADATAILLPSIWYETFGLTAIEAFAAGKPVVGSALGAMQEVIDDDGGVLVPPGDAPAWASALDTLAADPGRCSALGRLARARYERHFTPARDAERLLAIYRELAPHAAHPTNSCSTVAHP